MNDKTDDTEMDPKVLGEETLTPEETVGEEEWQDELPPEDDFHDHDVLGDDTSFEDSNVGYAEPVEGGEYEQEPVELEDPAEDYAEDDYAAEDYNETDTSYDESYGDEPVELEGDDTYQEGIEGLEDDGYEPEGQSEEDLAAAKKKGQMVFMGAIGVVVLAIGGFAYMELSGPSQTAAPPVTSLLNIQEVKRAPALAAKKDQADKAPSSDNVDMISLYQAGKTGPAVDLPLPSKSNKLEVQKDKKEEVVALSGVMASTEKLPSLPVPTAKMPAPAEIEKVETLPIIPAPAEKKKPLPVEKVEVKAEPSVPSKPSAEVEKKLADMTAKLKEMQAALSNATQENAQLVSKMETMQAKVQTAPTPAAAPSKDLEAKVKDLETKLAQKDRELTLAKEVAKTPVVAKKPVKKVRKKVSKPKVKKVVKKKARWVLRGATRSSAWIAPSRHSKELRRAAIGDVIPGVGRVVEIRQNGSKWQVIGTKGTIK